MSHVEDNVQIVPVRKVRSRMLGLDGDGTSGVLDHPFLEQGVAERIERAAQIASNKGYELVILDALRTLPSRKGGARARVDWNSVEREILSYGTGGAVDVALMRDGDYLPMGSAYGNKELRDNASEEATANRKLLQKIMEQAGFVGTENNWWHYEHGTRTWAKKTGGAAYLTEMRSPPAIEGVDTLASAVPIATPFPTAQERRDVMARMTPGHYYARFSHPTNEELAGYYRALLGVKNVGLVESGLAASISTLRGLVPRGGTIIYDTRIYYEVHRSILTIANDLGWNAVMCDMTNPTNLKKVLAANRGAAVVYADSPSNWFAEALNIEPISKLAQDHGALLVVDTSLQPLQNARAKGADVEVFSLSKYPSNGMAMGGAFVSDNAALIKKITQQAVCDGHMLAHSAAGEILRQSHSLKERLGAVSGKAERIAAFLSQHPDIAGVNCPGRQGLNGLCGGQISFLLKDASQGRRLEDVISNNTLSRTMPLHLSGTFGAAVTTIEHFASNPRYREGIPREATNEVLIPDNMVRLGIGLEPVEEIVAALNFVLNMSSARQPMPGVPRRATQLDNRGVDAAELRADRS